MPNVKVTSTGTTTSAGAHKHDIKSPEGKADDGNWLGRGYIWDKVKIYSTETVVGSLTITCLRISLYTDGSEPLKQCASIYG